MHPLSEDLPMSAPNHEGGEHLGSMGAAVWQVGRGDHNNPLIAVGDWLHHADASACLLTHLFDYSATFPNDSANLQGTKSVDGRACMLSRVRRIRLGCRAFFGKGRRLIHLFPAGATACNCKRSAAAFRASQAFCLATTLLSLLEHCPCAFPSAPSICVDLLAELLR